MRIFVKLFSYVVVAILAVFGTTMLRLYLDEKTLLQAMGDGYIYRAEDLVDKTGLSLNDIKDLLQKLARENKVRNHSYMNDTYQIYPLRRW